MEKITNRSLAIYVTTGVIVVTTTILFFILDALKDENPNKEVLNSLALNSGLYICLFCLPILGFISFLLLRINTDPNSNKHFKKAVDNCIMINLLFLVTDIVGIILILYPFHMRFVRYWVSFSLPSTIGFLLGAFLFVILGNLIKRAKLKN